MDTHRDEPQRSQQQRAGQGNAGQQSQDMSSAQGLAQRQVQGDAAKRKRDMSHIQGWGADLDHKNRPAHPRERMPPRLENVHWEQPEQQPVNVTVFHSMERPGITPVFGTSTPPSGLSGLLRAAAFTRSENDIRHWMMLLLADRINVVEGVVQDLLHGRLPNVFKEMGWRAERKYRPATFARKVVTTTALVGVAIYLVRRRSARRRRMIGW